MRKSILLATATLFLLSVTTNISDPSQVMGIVAPDIYQECSNFSMKHGDRVFFGSNDDKPANILAVSEATIMIYPPTAAGQGYAEFGYFTLEGRYWSRLGALNDSGLAYGTMSIPPMYVNNHPERSIRGFDNFFSKIMQHASNVEEVIEIASQTDFSDLGDTWKFQMQFADATGDSVVISPGLDGELVFTRMPVDQAYLVSTNFNRGLPKGTKAGIVESYERYDTAVTLLDNDLNKDDFSEMDARRVLDAVHTEWTGSFAASSRIFDLPNRDIYLYYYAQFDDGVKLNLADELKKGHQQIRVRDLFPQEVVERGETYHKSAIMRDMTILAILSVTVVSFFGSLSGLLFVVRNRRNDKANAVRVKLRLFMTAGISWAISFWGLLLFINNIYPPNLIKPAFPMQAMLVLGPLGALGIIVAMRAFVSLRQDQLNVSAAPGDAIVKTEGVLQ